MKSSHANYLEALEQLANTCNPDDFYLWPRTPITNLQAEILQRVGVSDYQVEDGRSRPALIIRQIKALIKHGVVSSEFSVLDICCGDAIVLWQIKRAFPRAFCYGVDFNKGNISTHEKVQRDEVYLYRAFIQHLFRTHPDIPFDLTLMLNTYRGWESADLGEHERSLPKLADAWFERNARYTILTVTDPQILSLRQLGFAVKRIGKGEDNSKMVCLSTLKLPNSLPVSWWQRLKRIMSQGAW